jgi:predicted transcriptional regulator
MKKPFTVQLPVELMNRIKKLKEEKGQSIQRIIAQAITEYLANNGY